MLRPNTRDSIVCWEPDPATGEFRQEATFSAGSEFTSPTLPIRVPVGNMFEAPTD
jgi:hypothetical protein